MTDYTLDFSENRYEYPKYGLSEWEKYKISRECEKGSYPYDEKSYQSGEGFYQYDESNQCDSDAFNDSDSEICCEYCDNYTAFWWFTFLVIIIIISVLLVYFL